MKSRSISVVIMARNESSNIQDAIKSVSFASQIVVADTGSSDDTMELARNCGAEVHRIEFDGYGTSKNRAIQLGKCDWILSIDADERVSQELANEIIDATDNSIYTGFRLNRLTYFLGKPVRHSGWHPEYVLRLFRNGKGRFSERLVHERIEVDGSVSELNGLLYHYSYKDLDSYLEKMNVYSSLNAKELYESGRKYHISDLLTHPAATFFKMYLLKRGFLDGANGFILASLSYVHVFVKYLKLREFWRQQPK